MVTNGQTTPNGMALSALQSIPGLPPLGGGPVAGVFGALVVAYALTRRVKDIEVKRGWNTFFLALAGAYAAHSLFALAQGAQGPTGVVT